MTIEELPARAQAQLDRLTVGDVGDAVRDGALPVDIRSELQLASGGLCDEGYQSSLAAMTLQEPGFARATDLVGGFQAWAAAGLPVLREVTGPGQVQPLRSVQPVADGAAAV